MTVHDEDTIHHGAVFLIGHKCQLITYRLARLSVIHIEGLIRRKEVVREGHYVEYISFGTGGRFDSTGEDGTIGQRVASREIRSISALHLHAVWDDERIVEGVIDVVIYVMFSRTRRRVPFGILAADGAVRIIALEPNLY